MENVSIFNRIFERRKEEKNKGKDLKEHCKLEVLSLELQDDWKPDRDNYCIYLYNTDTTCSPSYSQYVYLLSGCCHL